MNKQITIALVLFLIIIILFQGVQTFFLQRKLDKIWNSQVEEIEELKKDNIVKTDSIEILKKKKYSIVKRKQKNLYSSVKKAEQNNIRYEQIKKNAISNNSADSLERQLSRRYIKEKR